MPSLLSRTMLFLSSYAPLFIILAIRNWDSRYVTGALLVLTMGSVAWLLAFSDRRPSSRAADSSESM